MDYYHVRLTPKSDTSQVEVRLDLDIDELTERFVLPYRRGLPMTISGRSFSAQDVERIRINKTDRDSQYLLGVVSEERRRRASQGILDFTGSNDERAARKGEDVTDEFITGPPGTDIQTGIEAPSESRPPTETRTIFVVHGRNNKARDALFAFLRSVRLEPLEWNKAVQATGKPNPYIGEILDAAFSRAHAVLVLFTPDDEARLKESLRTQADPPHETKLTGQARPKSCSRLEWLWLAIKIEQSLLNLAIYARSVTSPVVTRYGSTTLRRVGKSWRNVCRPPAVP